MLGATSFSGGRCVSDVENRSSLRRGEEGTQSAAGPGGSQWPPRPHVSGSSPGPATSSRHALEQATTPLKLHFPRLPNMHNNVNYFTEVNNTPPPAPGKGSVRGSPRAAAGSCWDSGTRALRSRALPERLRARSSALSCSCLAPTPTPNGGCVSAPTVTLPCLMGDRWATSADPAHSAHGGSFR